jgi:hypothetical protein
MGKLHVDSVFKLLGGKEFREEINSTKKKLFLSAPGQRRVLQIKYEKFIFKNTPEAEFMNIQFH